MINDFYIKMFIFLFLNVIFGSIQGIRNIIKEIGYNSKFFPKYYIKPNRRVAKLLGIYRNGKLIPKHLYYAYFVVIIYMILFPISIGVYSMNRNNQVGDSLLMIYALIMIGSIVYNTICLMIYRKVD